jgi:Mn2+/Fe2+ NRAMP family transporter
VPLMAVIVLVASKRSVMGEFVASRTLRVLGWIGCGAIGRLESNFGFVR